jgi:integrase
MARGMRKLAAVSLNRLPTGMHGDGGNLWLQVTETGARTWLFRFRHAGKARAMGLGPLHTISLAEARDKARECRQLLLSGLDPIETRNAKRLGERLAAAKSMTFQECAEAYIAAHQAGWRNAKHAAQWPATLAAYVYPVIGALPVQAVDVTLVMKALEPIWTVKPETAGRVRGRIEVVLDWATTRGYRSGENPARWRGHLENLLPAKRKVRRVEHLAALHYAEISAFMAELRAQESVAARALEFAILTAARTGEVTGARWSEIDVEGRLWTIPAERMKAGREHRVPLSEAARAILAGLERKGSRIFPISADTMLDLLSKMRPGVTVHGFRSTFRTWAIEQTSTPREVAEMALAHAVGTAVEQAYQRSDLFEKRRQLAEAWARFCAGGRGKVIELRAQA